MAPADKIENKIPFLDNHPDGIVLTLFIQPRSSGNRIAGLHGDTLKIKLTAPPVDGAANKMCIDYLAKLFKLPKTALTLLSGHANRTKRVLIQCDTQAARVKILQLLKKEI